MATEIRSLYQELCTRGIVSPHDPEARAMAERADALAEAIVAFGRFVRRAWRRATAPVAGTRPGWRGLTGTTDR